MTVWHEALEGDTWLVGVDGRLDQTQNRDLENVLVNLLDEGYIRFVVDLTETTYINSGGLRTLVSAWRRARHHGGDLVLAGLSPKLQDVFSIVGFDQLFAIYVTPEEAKKAILSE